MTTGTDPYPYRRRRRPAGTVKKAGKPRVRTTFPLTSPRLPVLVALILAGFLLGRAAVLGELMPFGPALVAAAVRLQNKKAVWVTLAVGAGMACAAGASVLPAYLLAAALIHVLLSLLPSRLARPRPVVPGVTAAVLLIVRTAFVAFANPTAYGYITALFEAVFAAVLTHLFLVGLGPLVRAENPRALTAEELFSLLTLAAGVITGAGGYDWWFLSLRGVLSRFFVLVAAFLGGPGLGAAVGALAGVIPGLTLGTGGGMVNAYAFMGLVAGLCQGFGRLGVGLGFLLGNIVLSVYTADFTAFTAALAESGAAMVLYLLFPLGLAGPLRVWLAGILPPAAREKPSPDPVQVFLARRVRGWASILHNLAQAFEEVTAGGGREEQDRLQGIIDEVAATVCQGCSLHQTCWEREFYHTFRSLLDLVGATETRTGWQVSEDIRRRCPRHRELSIAALSCRAASRLDEAARRQWRQERDMVAVQMEAVAGMLETLATRVQEEGDWTAPALPPAAWERLRKKGLKVLSLSMEQNGEHGGETAAEITPCSRKTGCWQELGDVLQEHLALAFHPATRQCLYQEGDQVCRIRLYPLLRFRLSLGVALASREGSDISGDSFAICPLPDGRMALVLSDGMGTGPEAARESQAALRLLTELLQAGFAPEVAVRTVNAALILQKPEERFTTIDLAIVDLYSGEAAFIKVGAPPGFVGRLRKVGIVQADSLPAGIISNIIVSTSSRPLTAGDYIVLATDGVHEAHPDGGQDLWLAGLLQETDDVHPRELADLILNLASQRPARDDRTVLVARLEEN